jgi:hypothetical protein
LKVFISVVACLLLAVAALGQSTSTSPTLKPRAEASPAEKQAASENPAPATDTPVITIQGLCEKPDGTSAASSDCKTVITRSDFEKVAPANLPGPQKKRVADQYIQALLLAEKAHESGVDHSPEFEKQMAFLRLRALATAGYQDLQKQTSKVSDSEVEDYYKQHIADYKAISFDKLYVSKQKSFETSAQKPNDPELQKKREASEAEMKAEADKLRARAVAGEDFTKLQQAAYDFAGIKQTPQNTHMESQRKSQLLPADASIFDLKKGDVSEVFDDPAGFMVYKITDIKDLPVATVHDEIARTLQAEKLKAAMDGLQNSVKTTLDESYFAAPPQPTLRSPGELPVQNPPPPGKK